MTRPLAPLTTRRLTLRALRPDDVGAVVRIRSCPVTMRDVIGGPESAEAAAAWLGRRVEDEAAHGFSMWAVERAGGEVIGLCGLFAGPGRDVELAYVVHHEHQGRGFAGEAAAAAVEAARTAGRGVFATIRPANLASIRVAEKVGLHRTNEAVEGKPGLVMFRLPKGGVQQGPQ